MIPRIKKKAKRDVEIAIVNLVDVIFILLIFFIMTTTFSKETGVDISKPDASTASQLEKEHLQIGVSKDGTLHVHGRQVDIAMLQSLLRREKAEDPDKSVVIVADRYTGTGVIVDIMDQCNIAGIKKVSVGANAK